MTFTRLALPLDSFAPIEFEENGVLGRRSVLPGGIRVLSEKIPGQQSVSVSFWIGAGSRDEAAGSEGSTHFLEHLLFKGTKKRSCAQISQLSDYLGGAVNAATARLYTCYYGRVFTADLPLLLDLLTDMITGATLDRAQMDVERGVILEELRAAQDDAAEVTETALLPLVLGDHPLSRPVGGTPQTVEALKHEHLLRHYRSNYNSRELVITAAGDVDHGLLCGQVTDLLEAAGWNLGQGVLPAAPRRAADVEYRCGTHSVIPHPGRQSAVVVGMPGLRLADRDETAAALFEIILGGGTSSRLFREIREKRGLAYSVYSWSLNWNEGGVFAMEAGCGAENTRQVADLMRNCLEELAQNGVSEDELRSAVNQHRAQLVFAAETNGYRKNRLGYAELLRGEIMSVGELLRLAREVTADDIQRIAQNFAAHTPTVLWSSAE